MFIPRKIQLSLFSIGLFIFFIVCYNYLFNIHMDDIHAHFEAAIEIKKENNQYPANFLLYWLTNLGNTLYIQKGIFITIICASIIAKFIITFYSLHKNLNVHFYWLLLGALALLFIISLPNLHILQKLFYLGSFTPNVWHNTTIIFVMPVAMLLFYYSILKNKEETNYFFTILLIILNAIIKPSFLFVLIPLWGIFALIELRQMISFNRHMLFIMLTLLIIVSQAYIIYTLNVGSLQQEKSGITINFLHFYKLLFPNAEIKLLFALVSGYLFPFLYLIASKEYRNFYSLHQLHKLSKDTVALISCWLLVIFSILIFVFISESGPRAAHGNFYWQIVPSTYLLYLTSFILFLKNWKRLKPIWKYTISSVFCIGVVFGLLYFIKVLLYGHFL